MTAAVIADDTESTTTLLIGFAINALIALGKATLGALTGSASMLAEAVHSGVDMLSEIFLLTGVRHSRRWSKATYFWGLLACVNLFLSGAVYAVYEGITSLVGTEAVSSLAWVSMAVLAGSAVLESISLRTALRTIGGIRNLLRTDNVSVKTLACEDLADVIGCILAAVGNALYLITDSRAWDGIASLIIAVVLTAVAYVLGSQNIRLLSSAAA